MTEKQGLRKIYDQFKFIAIQPLKINIALFIDRAGIQVFK